ncbi:hypothetical protein FRACA_650005 [Frankia canadensis]|uniref:Uncharacterized protein n=1 Tax=Frankia canadensis TaxID=1836972 RepID=A0A2I2KZZ3_9ACTN|nr:hypothetical protein FRACA_650005 [Frankia canadensis]SOU58532.1 hypothetical protein FRACA_650005 [Frankia canadensis]
MLRGVRSVDPGSIDIGRSVVRFGQLLGLARRLGPVRQRSPGRPSAARRRAGCDGARGSTACR